MTESKTTSNRIYKAILIVTIVLQVIAALYFCTLKTGYHFDENYSYYSTNVTYGLVPTDGEWMPGSAISEEFKVTPGYGFHYGMVKLMQTYDVHPPFYYFVLHTICSFMPGVFSKWQGLAVNLIFFVLSLIMLKKIADIVGRDNPYITYFTVALFGFSPAVLSGITFIRMYMMLTFLCFLCLYAHLKDKLWLIAITTYIGFLTHYYFAVFLFFVAAFTTLYLFFNKDTRKKSFIYAGTVIGSMLLAVITYPTCLGHIFRGYRGTEAIGAFLDLGNLKERAGLFIGLLEEYVLCRSFYVIIMLLIVLYVSYSYAWNKGKLGIERREFNFPFALSLTVLVGYFLVVLKTALTNAEEAVRYEMPVYGILILILVYGIVTLLTGLIKNKYVVLGLFALILLMQFIGLGSNKVLFLYPEEADEVNFAATHKSDDIAYIYNYVNSWMIWDNAHELETYDDIFFIEMNHEGDIDDSRITNSDHIYAYVMRYDDADTMLNKLIESNPNISTATLLEERLYVDIYELR